MKSAFSCLTIILYFAIFPYTLNAQSKFGEIKDKLLIIQDSLDLDDQMIVKIEDIYKDYGEKLQALIAKDFKHSSNRKQTINAMTSARKIEITDVIGRKKIDRFLVLMKQLVDENKLQDLDSKDKKLLSNEINKYLNTNIIHNIRDARKNLDLKLQEDDKLVIMNLRDKVVSSSRDLRLKKIECSKIKPKSKDKIFCKKSLKQLSEQKASYVKEVTELVNKHDALITSSMEAVYELLPNWKSDINTIIASYFNTTADDTLGYKPKAGHFLKIINKNQFLIVNPDNIDNFLNTINDLSINQKLATIYYNPKNKCIYLEKDTDSTDGFTLKIYNTDGELVKNESILITDNAKVDLSFLKEGLYFCFLENSTAQVKLERFLITN